MNSWDAGVYYNLGNVRLGQASSWHAVRNYQQCISVSPSHMDAYHNLQHSIALLAAEIRKDSNVYEQDWDTWAPANVMANTVSHTKSTSSSAYTLMGSLHSQGKNEKLAVSSFVKALQLSPGACMLLRNEC